MIFQAKYQVKTEYREQERSNSQGSNPSSSFPLAPGDNRYQRRDSYGVYKEREAARRSYLRSHSEDVYTIPRTENTMLSAAGGGQTQQQQHQGPAQPALGGYQGGYLGGVRGAQHPNPEELWSRQTSMETSYNVPSIRTDMGEPHGPTHPRQYGRFDSIAEVSESRTDTAGETRVMIC